MTESDIDAFASSLLEEAKRFLERAEEAKGEEGEQPFLHASLMLAFCALEAHVNSVADEIALRKTTQPHQRAVLQEKDLRLKDGEFVVEQNFKMHRLLDRILVLHQLGRAPNIDGDWRPALNWAIDLRNKLTHPKMVPNITTGAVKKAIQAVIDTLDGLYHAVYKKRFPAAHRQLQSEHAF